MYPLRHPELLKYSSKETKQANLHKITGKHKPGAWTTKDARVISKLLSKGLTSRALMKILSDQYPEVWNRFSWLAQYGLQDLAKVLNNAARSRFCQCCFQFFPKNDVCDKCYTTSKGKEISKQVLNARAKVTRKANPERELQRRQAISSTRQNNSQEKKAEIRKNLQVGAAAVDYTERTKKIKKTLRKKTDGKYDNPSQDPKVQQTKRDNYLKKTNGKYSHPLQVPEIIAKVKDKWSVKTEEEITTITEKSRTTYLDRTGYVHSTHNPELEVQRKATNLERYGHTNAGASEFIRITKTRPTWLKKYGVEEIFASKEIQEKIRQHHLNDPLNGTPNPMGKESSLMKALAHKYIEVKVGDRVYGVGSQAEARIIPRLLKKYPNACTQYDIGKYQDKYNWRPDFWVPEIKKFIEVKCLYTLLLGHAGNALERNREKAESSIDVLWIVEVRKNCWIRLDKKWWRDPKFLERLAIQIEEEQPFVDLLANYVTNYGIKATVDYEKSTVTVKDKKLRIICRNLVEHSTVNPDFCKPSYVRTTSKLLSLRNKEGYSSLVIWAHDWTYSRTAIKTYLARLLGLDSGRVYARKCEIKVSKLNEDLRKFLRSTHVQGPPLHGDCYCLYIEDRLVACMVFAHTVSTRGSKKEQGQYELVRYSTRGSVVGGASRLFTAFLRDKNPTSVVSYSDYQMFSGEMYEILGFKKVSVADPTYKVVWCPATQVVKSKQSTRRSSLATTFPEQFDPELSEWENCKNLGLHRIYDCGLVKWKWSH